MNPLTQFKNTTILPFLIGLTLACFGPLPQTQAQCREGCLTNNNTVLGDYALINLTTGIANTAIGNRALIFNSTGSENTAIGAEALFENRTGDDNTAMGFRALVQNTSGSNNTANGWRALNHNRTGRANTANGWQALYFNTNGTHNTAIGFAALYNNRIGALNIALGESAGFNTTGTNNIVIGNEGIADESNTIRIGTVGTQTDTYIAGISGTTVPTGVAVIVDANGHLGTTTSSARFKEAIKPMDNSSEAILALKPVTFRYKKELDPKGIPQFGLVAEEVEKVNPALVARDEGGKPYSVRYEAVNAMLLNEFLKEHRTVQEQKTTIAELKSTMAQQQKQIEALTAGLQKVNAQLEASKPTPQLVHNP
jgi:Chaperone of endosialidase